jgi:predicted RNA binding protein YcfA (HicA-like mRNA interferase family)
VPKLPGVPHLQAVRALEKAGFRVIREGKHIVMSDGRRILTVPRGNPLTPSRWAVSSATRACPSSSSRPFCRGATWRSNKRMQLTKPAQAMELRS